MNRLGINLASRPFRNNFIHWGAFGACFVLLTAATWYNVHQFRAAGAEILALEEALRSRQESFATLAADVATMTETVSQVDLNALDERSSFANGVILSRLFSWTQLFDRLEEVQPENVRLRSIRPSVTREGIQVQVDAVAKEYASVLRFEEALLDSDYFTFVYPTQETSRESQGEIQFNLAFGYVPAGKTPPEPLPAAPTASAVPGAAPEAAPPAEVEDEEVPDEEDASGDEAPEEGP